MDRERATHTAARLGQGVAAVFGLVGLFLSPTLVVIAVFVWLGAQARRAYRHTDLGAHGHGGVVRREAASI